MHSASPGAAANNQVDTERMRPCCVLCLTHSLSLLRNHPTTQTHSHIHTSVLRIHPPACTPWLNHTMRAHSFVPFSRPPSRHHSVSPFLSLCRMFFPLAAGSCSLRFVFSLSQGRKTTTFPESEPSLLFPFLALLYIAVVWSTEQTNYNCVTFSEKHSANTLCCWVLGC